MKISALLSILKGTWRSHEPLPCRTPETPLERFITSLNCNSPALSPACGNFPAANLESPDLHQSIASYTPFIGRIKTIFKAGAICGSGAGKRGHFQSPYAPLLHKQLIIFTDILELKQQLHELRINGKIF